MFTRKRKIRVFVSGVKNFAQFLEVLDRLHELGEPQCQHTNYKTGEGRYVLYTNNTNRNVERAIARLDESVLTGIEDLSEDPCDECGKMVA